MEDKCIGIAKKDIEKGEEFELPIDEYGNIMKNEHINFIMGTNIYINKKEVKSDNENKIKNCKS